MSGPTKKELQDQLQESVRRLRKARAQRNEAREQLEDEESVNRGYFDLFQRKEEEIHAVRAQRDKAEDFLRLYVEYAGAIRREEVAREEKERARLKLLTYTETILGIVNDRPLKRARGEEGS